MKKLYIFVFLLNAATTTFAQVPQGTSYQAVARDASGAVLRSRSLSLRCTIRDSMSTGTSLYQETFTVTTNIFGLFNVNIGTGTILSGTFSTINWLANPKFMEVEMDATGSGFIFMGTQQLMSVPYSFGSSMAGRVMLPQMDSTHRAAISAPASGEFVYQTDGQFPGTYLFSGSSWSYLSGNSTWNISGSDIYNNNTGAVKIGLDTLSHSAILDVSSTSKGILLPRMDSVQRTSISSPATGLLTYQTDGLNPGYYYYTGSAWAQFATNGGGASSTPLKKTKITYQVSPGVGGGTAVAGTWTTRALNNVSYDDIGITLVANIVVLPAGTYEVSAYSVFDNANFTIAQEKLRIENLLDETTLGISLNSSMSVAANFSAYPVSIHDERFTLTSLSYISLQYYIDGPYFGAAYGAPGQNEIYAELIITKLQ